MASSVHLNGKTVISGGTSCFMRPDKVLKCLKALQVKAADRNQGKASWRMCCFEVKLSLILLVISKGLLELVDGDEPVMLRIKVVFDPSLGKAEN
jgi:hypothetical protein